VTTVKTLKTLVV